jgi:hypothetical protein
VYFNVLMLSQLILKLEFYEGQCEKCSLIFYTANDWDNGHLNKLYELKKINVQYIVCSKLMPWFSDMIFISMLFHGFKKFDFSWLTWKRMFTYPKCPLKMVWKPMN